MLIFISGLALGGCVGYLIWKYINPASGEFNLTLKIISGVIALILGGAVTAVFPAASPGFAGWAIGILAGFAFIPGKNAYGRWNVQREEAFQEEIQQMNAHWSAIDQFIQQKMQLRIRQIQPSVFEGTLSLEELKELKYGYSDLVLIQIMRRFAIQHVSEGVEYKTVTRDNEEGYEEEIHYLHQIYRQPLPATPINKVASHTASNDKVSLSFQTTYHFGNDGYDDSFSIDTPSGEFLGECGAGISAAIGSSTPKKVTAFEIWLFDKQDVQTQTKVLTSPNAYADPDTRKDLAQKGELVLAKPGRPIVLETKAIQVIARMVECSFAAGDSPKDNYFESLSIEFQVRLK